MTSLPSQTQYSILVIDDEPDNFDVIEALLSVGLSSSGQPITYHLHYAISGKDAIASLDLYQPDLILLDVMMPEMNGIEVCQHIKGIPQWRSVPIVMVTALSTKEDLALCLNAGADDFISKPLDGIELRARVLSMLRIKQQYDHLEDLLNLREDIVHMIIHDLRNPLTSILFGLEILEQMPLDREKQLEKIAKIRLASRHLQSLIDDLLLVAKMEEGRLKLNRSVVDIKELVNSAVLGFEETMNQKKLDLVFHLPPVDCRAFVDPSLFRRVLDNLLSNAIKFSSNMGKIVLDIDHLDSGSLRIQVADNGLGISTELKEKIFEKYEIGTMMQDVTQLGLGLAFCKMVVDAHQGEINVKDNEPQGSIFEIILASSPG